MKSSPEIFFSYAWDNANEPGENREKLVDQLYESLVNDDYNVIRDKNDVQYKDFFSDFMIELGKGKCIVVAISDKYLKSSNCMFELYEIARRSNFDKYIFREKILPIMLEFVDFNNLATMESYFSFWEGEYKRWNDFLIKRAYQLSEEQLQQFTNIKLIYQNFGKLTRWLADINTLNPKVLSADDFAEIKKAIFKYGTKRVSLWQRRIKKPAWWIATIAMVIILFLIAKWFRDPLYIPPVPAMNRVIGSAGENLLIVQHLNNKLFGYARLADTSLFISYKYEQANPFINGIALVKRNNKYQYIHSDSTDAFSGMYNYAENFTGGKARVVKGNDSFYIDIRGEIINDTFKVSQSPDKRTGKKNVAVEDSVKHLSTDSCLAICDTKGIKGVEVSFRDPRSQKLYSLVSTAQDLEFKVPCYLIEQSVTVAVITFKYGKTRENRNVKLNNFELPQIFLTD